jgi:hypothetical protein
VGLAIFGDGKTAIYNEGVLGWWGVWRREDVERVLNALKARESKLNDIFGGLPCGSA